MPLSFQNNKGGRIDNWMRKYFEEYKLKLFLNLIKEIQLQIHCAISLITESI